jgi:Reverse transcriptase (RNA-dependent DNA polymerase).
MEWFRYFEDIANDLTCDDGTTAIQFVSEDISTVEADHPSIQKTSTTQFTRCQLKNRDDTAALMNYIIYDLDIINAFGQAGELYQLVHMEIDNQYWDWHLVQKGKTIPMGWVFPVKGSIQGHHSDSGEVWQSKINDIIGSYGFSSTTHEPCLYRGIYKGHDMLICRQVDDNMLMAGKDSNIVIQEFARDIGKKLKVTWGSKPSTQFNGLDIIQMREGI